MGLTPIKLWEFGVTLLWQQHMGISAELQTSRHGNKRDAWSKVKKRRQGEGGSLRGWSWTKSEMFNLSGYALQLICCYMVWGAVFGARLVGVVSETDVWALPTLLLGPLSRSSSFPISWKTDLTLGLSGRTANPPFSQYSYVIFPLREVKDRYV